MTTNTIKTSPYDFLICRNRHENSYRLYRVEPDADELFTPVSLASDASFDHAYRMAQVGGYLLQWSPICQQGKTPGYQYKLIAFDPESPDPPYPPPP